MYYQPLLTENEKAIQQEVRKFVREEVAHDFIRALDRDEIKYPREYVEKLAAHHLLGLRFDARWGGRGLPWTAEVIAEEAISISRRMAGFRVSRQARDELGRVDAAPAVDNGPWNPAKRENKRFDNKNKITILKRKSSFPV